MRIHGGTIQGRRFEIVTRFRTDAPVAGGGAPVDATLLSVALDRPIAESGDLGNRPAHVRALADNIRTQCAELSVGPTHVNATLAGALSDPASIETLLESLAELSHSITRRRGQGAYRSA